MDRECDTLILGKSKNVNEYNHTDEFENRLNEFEWYMKNI